MDVSVAIGKTESVCFSDDCFPSTLVTTFTDDSDSLTVNFLLFRFIFPMSRRLTPAERKTKTQFDKCFGLLDRLKTQLTPEWAPLPKPLPEIKEDSLVEELSEPQEPEDLKQPQTTDRHPAPPFGEAKLQNCFAKWQELHELPREVLWTDDPEFQKRLQALFDSRTRLFESLTRKTNEVEDEFKANNEFKHWKRFDWDVVPIQKPSDSELGRFGLNRLFENWHGLKQETEIRAGCGIVFELPMARCRKDKTIINLNIRSATECAYSQFGKYLACDHCHKIPKQLTSYFDEWKLFRKQFDAIVSDLLDEWITKDVQGIVCLYFNEMPTFVFKDNASKRMK